jgi:hypothetical protein
MAAYHAEPSLHHRHVPDRVYSPRRACRGLHHVYTAVSVFLTNDDRAAAFIADVRLDSIFSDTLLYTPPLLCGGPRKDCAARQTDTIDGPSPFLAIHFAWDFLHPRDRAKLPTVSIMWLPYARLRQAATHESIGVLQHPRPAPVSPPEPVSRDRAQLMGIALLRFNFHYADLIRWLGGEYTDAHRDWSSSFAIIAAAADTPIPPELPPVDFDRAFRLATEGAPIAGRFSCTRSSLAERNIYEHHPTLDNEKAAVWTKLAKEEALSYQIILPRFLWRFIYGLHLSPLTYVVRRPGEEGRSCVDSSTQIGQHATGAPNDNIPKPYLGQHDLSPPVHYGSALTRHLVWIWNTRISHPREEIIQNVDDISCAFHRMLLHPTMGPAFASVFGPLLIIPCGCTFGAGNSPGIYMTHGELRAHLSSTIDFRGARSDLAENLHMPPPLTTAEVAALVQATPDALHQGIEHMGRMHHHASFVDDTATAHTRANIYDAINRSVLGAYIVFGFPDDDRRTPAINPKKWQEFLLHITMYLGLEIDTRLMLVIWPLDKRDRLVVMIDTLWVPPGSPPAYQPTLTPRDIASLLGLVRHGATVSQMGNFLSIRLQHSLNDAIRNGLQTNRRTRRWWRTQRITVPIDAMIDIRALRRTLDSNQYHPYWCRPIGLLIPREPCYEIVGDAANEGLGGYCVKLAFMWRLNRSDMENCGFRLSDDDGPAEPADPDASHINILEFVAIVINVWFLIKFIARDEPPNSQTLFIASCLGDNTSALSWMRVAGRTRRPAVRRLARALAGLLTHHSYLLSFPKQHIRHIRGVDNIAADALSRPSSVAPSWGCAIRIASPTLDMCNPYQVPRELLTSLSSLISSEPTEEAFEGTMIALLNLELRTLPLGWDPKDTTTSLLQ